MTTLKNSIIINAPIDKIWTELATVDRLAKYDPGAKNSVSLSETKSGEGSKRRVEMEDGKNWFEEECTVYQENEALKYELTNCSFPVHNLHHSYSFKELDENRYEVSQVQQYQMKYGVLGQIMGLLIRPKWNRGVRAFLNGLKETSEK